MEKGLDWWLKLNNHYISKIFIGNAIIEQTPPIYGGVSVFIILPLGLLPLG
jgi:hypothetical protein